MTLIILVIIRRIVPMLQFKISKNIALKPSCARIAENFSKPSNFVS